MLQYELRIRRLWKCPKCGRTVRTRGGVASRSCSCSEPSPFMELIETPPPPAFDASPFTTYDNEVDAAPTERELVEELPAHLMPPPIDTENAKPTFRRGTGYLRAEVSPEEASVESAADGDTFGAGIEADNTSADATAAPVEPVRLQQTSTSPGTAESANDSGDDNTAGNDDTSRGRKRRRRRRRKPRDERTTSHQASDSRSSAEVALPATEQPEMSSSSIEGSTAPPSEGAEQSASAGDAAEKESSGAAPKRKRRRRRRKRGK